MHGLRLANSVFAVLMPLTAVVSIVALGLALISRVGIPVMVYFYHTAFMNAPLLAAFTLYLVGLAATGRMPDSRADTRFWIAVGAYMANIGANLVLYGVAFLIYE